MARNPFRRTIDPQALVAARTKVLSQTPLDELINELRRRGFEGEVWQGEPSYLEARRARRMAIRLRAEEAPIPLTPQERALRQDLGVGELSLQALVDAHDDHGRTTHPSYTKDS